MMFNHKAKRISELENQNADLQHACDIEHGPFINLAKEIGDRAVSLATQDNVDITTSVDLVVQDLTHEQQRELIREQFRALAPESRFAILHQIFGDKEIAETLELKRQKAI